MGAVSSLGNGFSRIFWGMLFKCTGYKFVTSLNFLLQIIVYSSFRYAVHYPGAYLFLILLNGICVGGNIAVTPTYCQIVFGIKWGSKVFGFYIISLSIANFLQYGLLIGVAPLISLDGVLYICLGIVILALFILIITDF
jgi:hypothetical protein